MEISWAPGRVSVHKNHRIDILTESQKKKKKTSTSCYGVFNKMQSVKSYLLKEIDDDKTLPITATPRRWNKG